MRQWPWSSGASSSLWAMMPEHASRQRNHHRRAAGGVRGMDPVPFSREIPAAVPQEHGLEVEARTVRDAFDLAHVSGPGRPGRGFEEAQALRTPPLAHQRPVSADRRNDVPQGALRCLAEGPADGMGIAACGQDVVERAAHRPAAAPSIRSRNARARESSWADSPSSNHCSDVSIALRASSFLPARIHNGARSSTTRSSSRRAVW